MYSNAYPDHAQEYAQRLDGSRNDREVPTSLNGHIVNGHLKPASGSISELDEDIKPTGESMPGVDEHAMVSS